MKVHYPYRLIFEPNSQVKNMFSHDYKDIFTDQLKRVPLSTN